MPEGYIQLPPNSTGALVRTQTVAGTYGTEHQEVDSLADPDGTLAFPSKFAQDGQDATGITPPTGGSGIRGWLSGIYNKLVTGIAATVTNWPSTTTVVQSTGLNLHTTVDSLPSVAVSSLPSIPAGTNLVGQIEVSDGTNVIGTSVHPVRTDPTGTTSQPVTAASLPLPANAAQETGGHLAAVDINTSHITDGTAITKQGGANTLANAWPVEVTDGINVLGTVANPVQVTGAVTLPVGQAVELLDSGGTNKVSIDGNGALKSKDDFQGGEALADQAGAGAVLTFSFLNGAVQMLVIEAQGSSGTARADPFGGVPTATQGVVCDAGVPTYIPVTASSVKIFAPVGLTLSVYGLRRA